MRGDQLARWRMIRAVEANSNGVTEAEQEETSPRTTYRDPKTQSCAPVSRQVFWGTLDSRHAAPEFYFMVGFHRHLQIYNPSEFITPSRKVRWRKEDKFYT